MPIGRLILYIIMEKIKNILTQYSSSVVNFAVYENAVRADRVMCQI